MNQIMILLIVLFIILLSGIYCTNTEEPNPNVLFLAVDDMVDWLTIRK
jgi:hypothetical protein